MALRDQPYLPLYVRDFLADEKLAFCSASATGVYIRLMCLMHQSEEYGKILLKQKFKQSDKQIKNFASQLAIQMPYDYNTILCALEELLDSRVLLEEPSALIQKRMVKDNNISIVRASAGKKGGNNSIGKKEKNIHNFALNFAQAKTQANYVNEIVIDNAIDNANVDREKKEVVGKKKEKEKKEQTIEIFDELSFDNVWTLYGKKGNRKTSERKWANLKNHCREAAIRHIPKYVAATPDIQFRKNLETYINQECWNDEIITNSKSHGTSSSLQNDEEYLQHIAAGIQRAKADKAARQ